MSSNKPKRSDERGDKADPEPRSVPDDNGVTELERGLNNMSMDDPELGVDTATGAKDVDDDDTKDSDFIDGEDSKEGEEEDTDDLMHGVNVELGLKAYVEEQCDIEGERLRELLAASNETAPVLVMRAKNFSVINHVSISRGDMALAGETESVEALDEKVRNSGQELGLEAIAEETEETLESEAPESNAVTECHSGSSDTRPPAAMSAGARAEVGDEQMSACVNRVELSTNFDFSKVEQVLVSPDVKAVPDAISKNYNFITLLLRARACFLLVGYAYPRDCTYENPLTDWVFVNSNFEETQFHIDVSEP